MTGAYYFEMPDTSSNAVAWIALVISAGALIWTVWTEFNGYRRRQADEYWYRTVFSPNCIEPVITLLNEHLESLERVAPDTAADEVRRAYGEMFAQKKEDLLAKLWISRMFSDAYYDLACSHLDNIEDEMAERFGTWAMKPDSACRRDLVMLRENAVVSVTKVLQAAAQIDLNRFLRPRSRFRVLGRFGSG